MPKPWVPGMVGTSKGTTTSAVPIPAPARAAWQLLSRGEPDPPRFDPSRAAGLPEPIQRWLDHSVRPGTLLCSSVELTMSGQLKLGASWRPFRARQVLAPAKGFVWAAEARVMGLPVRGFDRFSEGTGQMRWRLLDIVPVMSADGADVTRSAAGRLACEGVLVPTAFGSAAWADGPSDGTAIMSRQINHQSEEVQLRFGPDGRLNAAFMQRWGEPGGAPPGRYPFGVSVEEEAEFEGIVIPSAIRAAWWWGTGREAEGEFFHARISSAVFR